MDFASGFRYPPAMFTTNFGKLLALTVFVVLVHRTNAAFGMTGNEWLNLTTIAQEFYIAGTIDTWLLAKEICKKSDQDCSFIIGLTQPTSWFAKGTYHQVATIVRSYMKDNPSVWHHNMVFSIWMALDQACKKSLPEPEQ